jgi:hypothetical protein
MPVERGRPCEGGKRSLGICEAAWPWQGAGEHAGVVSAGDEDLVERAVECLLEDLDDDAAFQRLTPEERAATLAWVLVGLVGNGGFEAWVESVGQRTPDAVVGLRLLGADAHAVLLEQVARLYPTAGAADAGTRLSAMDAWGDREVSQLHDLTQRFFELQQVQDLEARFIAPFVRAHPREFPMRVEDL